jgi:translation initiation factor IF-1
VVARTIGRIGYPCGQVATASAMGGGVFKVTCTSGHSYRAAPVGGRYRFRRM